MEQEIKECIYYDAGDCMDFACEGSSCRKRNCARKDMLKDEEMAEYVQDVENRLRTKTEQLSIAREAINNIVKKYEPHIVYLQPIEDLQQALAKIEEVNR